MWPNIFSPITSKTIKPSSVPLHIKSITTLTLNFISSVSIQLFHSLTHFGNKTLKTFHLTFPGKNMNQLKSSRQSSNKFNHWNAHLLAVWWSRQVWSGLNYLLTSHLPVRDGEFLVVKIFRVICEREVIRNKKFEIEIKSKMENLWY